MDWLVVGLAGFLGGMLNALAGGGSFITLPALIFAGVPPVSANATGTAALLPGYVASAWRFRKDIEIPANLGLGIISIIPILGGCIGAVILLISSESLFSILIPWLILFATIAFIISPRLIKQKSSEIAKANDGSSLARKLKVSLVLFIICIYGGYFNGGLGIIILAALGMMGQDNLLGMNGLKNFLSVLLTVAAVMVYGLDGTVSVKYLFVLGLTSILGAYTGASIAYKLSPRQLRYIVIAVGILMSLAFFIKSS